MKFDTIKEAAQEWVKEFNMIPRSVVEKLIQHSNYCDLNEITPAAKGDRVDIFSGEYSGEYGEIKDYNKMAETYIIELDNGELVCVDESDFEIEREDGLPMWGYMWAFGDTIDNYWLEEKEGLQVMADCGFRIYESEDWGYVFGIDGAGYDFYEAHWIPLYKTRGLRWHKETEDK